MIPACQRVSDEESLITQIFSQTLHESPCKIERLSQGWTNHNYKVNTIARTFFVRIGTDHPGQLCISRERELMLYDRLKSLGIAPQLVYAKPDRGILVTEFIENTTSYGKVLGQWTGPKEEVIDKIIQLMKKVHSQKASPEVSSAYPYEIIRKYYQECVKAGVSLPPTIVKALDCVEIVKKEPLLRHDLVLCHHDFFWENILFDQKKLWLVDWEYADWDDPYYDLAGFCIAHRLLEQEERDLVLKEYCGSYGENERRKLSVMCMLYSLKNALWGFLQMALCSDIPSYIHTIAQMHYDTFWVFHKQLFPSEEKSV